MSLDINSISSSIIEFKKLLILFVVVLILNNFFRFTSSHSISIFFLISDGPKKLLILFLKTPVDLPLSYALTIMVISKFGIFLNTLLIG